jgi:hypothetical protein
MLSVCVQSTWIYHSVHLQVGNSETNNLEKDRNQEVRTCSQEDSEQIKKTFYTQELLSSTLTKLSNHAQ